MKSRLVWKVTVLTSVEGEEAVTDLVQRVLEVDACSYRNIESRNVTVTAFLAARAGGFESIRAELRRGIEFIRKCGLNIGSGRISIRRLRQENWAESWKQHFKPIEIGSELLVKPHWSRRRPQKNQVVVVVDPGLSFGTGQHPTTRFCLQQLVARRKQGEQQSFLDIGTGSGILAIAAAKMGYQPVEAFDNDREAIAIAKANARMNGVTRLVHFSRQDLTRPRRRAEKRFSVVCANLETPLLIQEHKRIAAQLDTGGLLVLAGILRNEFLEVRKAFEGAGLRFLVSKTEKEWKSGMMETRDA